MYRKCIITVHALPPNNGSPDLQEYSVIINITDVFVNDSPLVNSSYRLYLSEIIHLITVFLLSQSDKLLNPKWHIIQTSQYSGNKYLVAIFQKAKKRRKWFCI